MGLLEKNPESKTQIRFVDCDPFNHLNNSKYIDYFLNAREDHLIAYYNLDIANLVKEKGIAWLVSQNQIAYLKPAATMETVVIKTQLLSFTENRILIEATMWNEKQTTLKAILWTNFIHYNIATMRTETHSEELIKLLKQVLNPLAPQMSFEDRVENLKQNSSNKK